MPIRPAPILAVEPYTYVLHIGPGREDYFGETPASVEHVQRLCGPVRVRRERPLSFHLEGDWT